MICEEYGWLPSEVDDMEWDVIDSIARKGKPSRGIKIKTAEDIEMSRRNWRKFIRGFGN